MSDLSREFGKEYYDQDYFKTPEGKRYRAADGTVHGWSYANPDGEFLGAGPIARAWKEVFEPRNLLDVGAGRGTFVAYARDAGIEAEGFDFSEWATSDEGRYNRCKAEWLKLHDATEPWPYEDRSFDLVVALDFLEHIYEEDLGFVLGELYRVASKYVFLQIAVSGSGGLQGRDEAGYKFKRGEEIPVGLEGCAVAGHVTVQPKAFWHDRLDREDWMPRRDMVNWFYGLVDPAIVKNWAANAVIVLERAE